MDSTCHRKSVQPTFRRNPKKPRQYCPIKRGVVCEDVVVCPVELAEECLYLLVSPAEPLRFIFPFLYAYADHLKVRVPHVFFGCVCFESKGFAVVRLEIDCNYFHRISFFILRFSYIWLSSIFNACFVIS